MWKLAGLVILVGGLIGASVAYKFYQDIFASNISAEGPHEVFVPKGSEYSDLMDTLTGLEILEDPSSFQWVASKKNLASHIYAGRYMLKKGMSNNDIVNLFRSGSHTPVKVTFSYARKKDELAGKISEVIEADSIDLINQMNNADYLSDAGFSKENIISLFIPNTYQFNWSTNSAEFFQRMEKEYNRFWNEERLAKANALELDPKEVSTLASIVQSETIKQDESPRIAGVYVNRLQRGMALEADPTLVFALGDFTIKRVLNKHKKIDSPYNTYKYAGLPPGPICLPSPPFIDAVLNYEDHEYIFFCAKEDFSGYSNFAKTYSQHLVNARKYHRALNDRGIYR